MSKENGGAAFPQSGYERWLPEGGMNLRDYFAAKALQGLCSNQKWLENADKSGDAVTQVSRAAYEAADAMLAARKVPQ